MTKKKLMMLLGSVCLALVLVVSAIAGCAAPTPTPTPEKVIKIGVPLELTGACAKDGGLAKESIELRLEEANYQVAGKVY